MPKQSKQARKWVYGGASVALSLAVLGGCASAPSGNTQANTGSAKTVAPQRGGTLRMIMEDHTDNIGFPALSPQLDYYYSSPALETLGRYNAKGIMEPFLAKGWKVDPKAKTITFYLRKGVKFQDGTDFDAEALKWNIQQFQNAHRPEVDGIKSMQVVDKYTLKLNLVKFDNQLLESICWFVQIISPTAVKKHGIDWAKTHPVGTGPFTFVAWNPDVSIIYKRNPNYWQKGKPYLDEIDLDLIYDANTAYNTFISGGADVLTRASTANTKQLEASGQYKFNTTRKIAFGAAGYGFMFPSANPKDPLSNLKVREAVEYAINKNAIIKSVLHGYGEATNQWYTPRSPFYNPAVKGFPYNPAKAKQLLKEAGYPNGFQTQIWTDAADQDMVTAVQNYLAQVGIKVKINVVDIAKLIAITSSSAPKWTGMTVYIWPTFPNAPVLIDRNFSPHAAYFAQNILHPPILQQLIAKARSAPDHQTEVKYVQQIQKVLFQDYALVLPMYITAGDVFMKKNVQNLGMFTTNGFDWNPESVWLSK
ncbi:MAG: ABC transporter substrate-binding protein [Alicyclobacillaceae bacterium]|nr:ABC transporter substrate-binding protein [Alicyclobacillaceae bacterium]